MNVSLSVVTAGRAWHHQRLVRRLRELMTFGAVGLLAAVVDVGGSDLLRFDAGVGPLTSKAISAMAAAGVAYLGNRFWTFRRRGRTGMAREFALFLVLNGIGLLISLLCVGFTAYALGLRGPLAYNVSANVIGLGLGTAFRYITYQRWVFPPAAERRTEADRGCGERRCQELGRCGWALS